MKSIAVFSLVSFVVVFGCAVGNIQPGISTEADVRQSMGVPALELRLEDGGRQLAYATGPMGTQTHMVVLRADGRVARVEQVLTDDQFARIVTGRTTQEEVRLLIGPPYRRVRFDNLKQDAWDYRFRDAWGYLAEFSVMIDDRGIVANKVTVRFDSGRDRGR